MNGPSVKDLLKLPGARVERPREQVILMFDEFMLLHNIAMAHPYGYAANVLDKNLTVLGDHQFVKQNSTTGRFHPTPEGLRHLRPDLYRKMPNKKAH